MIMKRLNLILMFCLLVVSCEKEPQKTLVEARGYFESHATNLMLPGGGPLFTKSIPEIQNIYPDWSKASVYENNGGNVVEVPLSGACKIVAVLFGGNAKDSVMYKTSVVSKLIMDYSQDSSIPTISVRTIIQKRKRGMNSSILDARNFDGFVIQSNINGEILNITAYCNGLVYDATNSFSKKREVYNKKESSRYFGFRLGYAVPSKSDSSVSSGCSIYAWIVCPVCHRYYYTDIDYPDPCPECQEKESVVIYYCSNCGNELSECKCETELPICKECNMPEEKCASNSCGCTCSQK